MRISRSGAWKETSTGNAPVVRQLSRRGPSSYTREVFCQSSWTGKLFLGSLSGDMRLTGRVAISQSGAAVSPRVGPLNPVIRIYRDARHRLRNAISFRPADPNDPILLSFPIVHGRV